VVAEADSAAAALALFERFLPDLALIDVCLGDDDGFELARTLTAAHPSLTVVVMSSDASLGATGRFRSSGARRFVPKAALTTAALGDA
jgi:DNA-binding NarL/FixJ family response regulator